MRWWFVLSMIACGGASGGSASTTPSPAPASVAAPAPAAPAVDPEPVAAAYKVKFETTKGNFVLAIHPEWAPKGADRFKELVKMGWFDGCKFFRVIDGFMVQFGINGNPELNDKWQENRIPDDPVKTTNSRGRISFATRGPNTRTTQVFINFGDNGNLDGMGFAPFGEVVEGMEIVDSLFKGYGEGAPRGRGPDQGMIQSKGNAYLEEKFPKLDGIVKATLVE